MLISYGFDFLHLHIICQIKLCSFILSTWHTYVVTEYVPTKDLIIVVSFFPCVVYPQGPQRTMHVITPGFNMETNFTKSRDIFLVILIVKKKKTPSKEAENSGKRNSFRGL